MTSAGRDALRILVAGRLGANPAQGGATWAVLQWVLGLRGLGHDVCLVEELPHIPHAAGGMPSTREAAYFMGIARRFSLEDRAALLVKGESATVGMHRENLRRWSKSADVVFNLSGSLTTLDLCAHTAVRVYVDLDPAFTQLWQYSWGIDMGLAGHNRFATVGQLIGTARCQIPTGGLHWIHFLPPVALSYWPTAERRIGAAVTTVANWRSYGSMNVEGIHYGQKAHSFRELLGLPARTRERLEVALSIHAAEVDDIDALRMNGWSLIDPVRAAGTPDRYQRFIACSKAELGIAKSGYVHSHCGWFGDRSACYLASGRPVVAQDTGWARLVTPGLGLLAFDDCGEAAEALDKVGRDYSRHCRAARTIATEFFDSTVVLDDLLEAVGRTTGMVSEL